ncbi:hypothetical protein F5B17DRAFT_424626 [Nemania serpens]|nr:hypothetical protein F5B17DRAFT_424626 [Nemania serpens]
MKSGTNFQLKSWHGPYLQGVLGPILGVTKHRELYNGLIELYVHHLVTLPNGQRIVHGRWEQERVTQAQHEKAVLAYWSGVGGRYVALGSHHRFHPFRILQRGVGDWYLVQWVGYPPCVPHATWARIFRSKARSTGRGNSSGQAVHYIEA